MSKCWWLYDQITNDVGWSIRFPYNNSSEKFTPTSISTPNLLFTVESNFCCTTKAMSSSSRVWKHIKEEGSSESVSKKLVAALFCWRKNRVLGLAWIQKGSKWQKKCLGLVIPCLAKLCGVVIANQTKILKNRE